MNMRAIDVYRNLESFKEYWEILNYSLSKSEAEVVIEALKLLLEKEEKENADT